MKNHPTYRQKSKFLSSAGLIVVLSAAFHPGGAAQEPPPPPNAEEQTITIDHTGTHRLSLNIKEADLHEILLLITKDSALNLVMEPGIDGVIPALDLKNVTIPEALDFILPNMGLEYRLKGNLLSVGRLKMQTQLFYLNYIAASRSGTRDMRLTTRSQVGGSGSSVSAGGQQSGSGSEGGSSSENQSTLTTANHSEVWADLQTGLENIIFPEDTAENPAQQSESGPSTTATKDKAGRQLLINPHAGVIMIHAEPKALEEAANYIDVVEKSAQRQVLIEARVVEVTLSKDHQLGVNWTAILNPSSAFTGLLPSANGVASPSLSVSTGSVMNQSVNPSMGHIQYSISNGKVGAVIDALSRQGQLRVLSSPHVSALNNQKAVIRVVREEVFFTQSSVVSQSVGPTVTTENIENQIVPIGVVLDIIPQISMNGEIILSINPSISELVEIRTFTTDDGNAVSTQPVIDRRDLDTVAKVNSGETVLIAGILRERKSEDLRGVPWLMNVPFIGNAFRRTEQSLERTELVILITPTLLTGQNIENLAEEKNREIEEMAPSFKLGTVEPVKQGLKGELGTKKRSSSE
jgi:MSHA biogenesis protein MshL